MKKFFVPHIRALGLGYCDLNYAIPKSQIENFAQDSIFQVSVYRTNK